VSERHPPINTIAHSARIAPETPLVSAAYYGAAPMSVTPLILTGTRYLRKQIVSEAIGETLLITSIKTAVIGLSDCSVVFI